MDAGFFAARGERLEHKIEREYLLILLSLPLFFAFCYNSGFECHPNSQLCLVNAPPIATSVGI
jgi:hypothetical protein